MHVAVEIGIGGLHELGEGDARGADGFGRHHFIRSVNILR
jgi:hypothetical protein